MKNGIFENLEEMNSRPAPFQFYTAKRLWTDSHIAKRMLEYHLNPAVDAASRSGEFMDRSALWIRNTFKLKRGVRVADMGCGPGLMTSRLARMGAEVTGIDFSRNSIAWAREAALKENLPVTYLCADYLSFDTTEKYDLIIMIMCDFCALSPGQRNTLAGKFHSLLNPGGAVLLDVFSMAAFHESTEESTFSRNLMKGFWAPGNYWGFYNSFRYPEEKVTLEKYSIYTPEESFTVYNWLQYFKPEDMEEEFPGFTIRDIKGDVAGAEYTPEKHQFAIIAGREQ